MERRKDGVGEQCNLLRVHGRNHLSGSELVARCAAWRAWEGTSRWDLESARGEGSHKEVGWPWMVGKVVAAERLDGVTCY